MSGRRRAVAVCACLLALLAVASGTSGASGDRVRATLPAIGATVATARHDLGATTRTSSLAGGGRRLRYPALGVIVDVTAGRVVRLTLATSRFGSGGFRVGMLARAARHLAGARCTASACTRTLGSGTVLASLRRGRIAQIVATPRLTTTVRAGKATVVVGTGSAGGVTVDAPAGALPAGATISIVPMPVRPNGSARPEFTIRASAQPRTPVRLTVPYTGTVGAEANPSLAWYADGSWHQVATTVDRSSHVLTASIRHFSLWDDFLDRVAGSTGAYATCSGAPPSWVRGGVVVSTAREELAHSCAQADGSSLQLRVVSNRDRFIYVEFAEQPSSVHLVADFGTIVDPVVRDGDDWRAWAPPGATLEADFAQPAGTADRPVTTTISAYAGRDAVAYVGDLVRSDIAQLSGPAGVALGPALAACAPGFFNFASSTVRATRNIQTIASCMARETVGALPGNAIGAGEDALEDTLSKTLLKDLGDVGVWVAVGEVALDVYDMKLDSSDVPLVLEALVSVASGTTQPPGQVPVTPVSADPLTSIAGISGGYDHSCALLTTGDVDCWGDESHGQVGNLFAYLASPTPIAVAGLGGVTAISAGWQHTCALRSGGAVVCWGRGQYGELGDGGTVDSSSPVAVAGLGGATAVATGDRYSCALRSVGTVACWGDNTDGELGDSSTTSSPTPVTVSGITDATAIGADQSHTCAIRAGGSVVCWGNDDEYQLGDGTRTASPVPVAVVGLADATAISVGGSQSCALRSGGSVVCWGNNPDGIGDGQSTAIAPTAVTGIGDATAISAGVFHACALRAGGTVACWGDNDLGGLGTGSEISSTTPVAVAGLTDAVSVSVGNSFTCAVRANATAVCWGWNQYGQLGTGTYTSTDLPVAVVG